MNMLNTPEELDWEDERRTPSPYSLELMDAHERFTDQNHRKIARFFQNGNDSLESHYGDLLEGNLDNHGSKVAGLHDHRDELLQKIKQTHRVETARIEESDFHKQAAEAIQKIEKFHMLKGGDKAKRRNLAQKRWSMVKTARLLGGLSGHGGKEATDPKMNMWKKTKMTTKLGVKSLDADKLERMAMEQTAARKQQQRRSLAGQPTTSDIEWTPQQRKLLFLVQLASRDGRDDEVQEGWVRRTPLMVWLYEAIAKGLFDYKVHGRPELIGGQCQIEQVYL